MQQKYYIPPNFLTSERYYHAKTTTDAGIFDTETYTIKKWFINISNIKYLTHQLFRNYIKHNNNSHNLKSIYDYFKRQVPIWMSDFIKEKNIEFYTEDIKIKSFKYFLTSLSKINREFYKEYKYISEGNNLANYGIYNDSELPGLTGVPDFNPFRAKVITGVKNEFENTLKSISLHDMVYGVENTRNMDVWQEQKTIKMNKNFRYNNAIPVWQCLNRNKIGLDRSNEGLEHGDSERSSLETPIRGYEMSDIYKNADTSLKYNKYGSKRRW